MKNNIFQKILVSMLVIISLLMANSVMAITVADQCEPKDYFGSCGVFDESDLEDVVKRGETAKPDVQVIGKKLNKILNERWQENFKCYVLDCWVFWTDAQKQQVIDRMYKQSIISSLQAKNWKNSPFPPCVINYESTPKDFIGSCGIFSEEDFDLVKNETKPDLDQIQKKLNKILNERWRDEFKCYVLDGWKFWTNAQKEQVINRMYKQNVLTPVQFENWRKMTNPPTPKGQVK